MVDIILIFLCGVITTIAVLYPLAFCVSSKEEKQHIKSINSDITLTGIESKDSITWTGRKPT